MANKIPLSSTTSPGSLSPANLSITSKENQETIVEKKLSHPRDQYFKWMQDQQKMRPDGSLQVTRRDRIPLPKAGLTALKKQWQEKQNLGSLVWNLNDFLPKLLEYFSTVMKGTQAELTTGTLFWVGKEGWASLWEEGVKLDASKIPHDLWNFSTPAPECFEIHFFFPTGTEIFPAYLELCTYLIAVQAFPDEQLSYVEALREFGYMTHLDPHAPIEEKTLDRVLRVRQIIEDIQPFLPKSWVGQHEKDRLASFEVPLNNQRRLKIVFSYNRPPQTCFQCDSLRLRLTADIPFAEVVSDGLPLDALNDLLLHRLVPIKKTPAAFGLFLTYLTEQGQMLYSPDLFSLDNWKKETFLEALNSGKSQLISPKNSLIAFYFHALQYLMSPDSPLEGLLKILKDYSDGESLSLLGRFLYHHMGSTQKSCKELIAALTFASVLQFYLEPLDANGVRSRIIANGTDTQIEVSSPHFYLVFPYSLDSTMAYITAWLKLNQTACLSCISEAVTIFVPAAAFKASLPLPQQELGLEAKHQLQEIYRTLRSQPFAQASLLCFLALQKTGGVPIEEDDILALPRWLNFSSALQNLEEVFKGSPFKFLFQRIKERLVKENNADTIPTVCLEELVVSDEPKLAPRAWTDLRKRLDPSQYVSFMLAVLPRLNATSLPIVAGGLGDGCSTEQRIQLLAAYADRLPRLPQVAPLLLTHGSSWIDQIDSLLEKVPALDRFVIPYPDLTPRLRNFAALPKTSDKPTELSVSEKVAEKLEELPNEKTNDSNESGSLLSEKDPDKLWEQLLRYQKTGSGVSFVEITEHIQNTLPSLCQREGFFSFFEWLAQGLAKKKEYNRILSLARLIPVNESPNESVLLWIRTSLGRLIKAKVPAGELIEPIKYLREKGFYPHLPSTFLLKVLQHLVDSPQTAEMGIEIRALIEAITPEQGSASSFAACIVTYYQTLKESRFAQEVIEGVDKRLTLLTTYQRAGVAAIAATVGETLSQTPKEKKLFMEQNPEGVWKLLLSLQRIVQESGPNESSSQAFVDVIERAVSSPGAQLSACKGFALLMQQVIQALAVKGEYKRILALLPYIPILKTDKIFHPWYPKCLQHLLDQKASLDEMVEAIEILRKEDAADYVTADLLLDLLENLLKKSTEDKKTKDEKVRRAIHFLKDRIQPGPTAAARFVTCLLTYYPHLLETGHAVLLIEDLIKHFSLFVAQKEKGFIPHVISAVVLLTQTPKEEKNWEKVPALMELLQREDSCRETVLSIFETLTAGSFLATASLRDPPFQVFKKGLAKFAAKLSDPQKARFRKTLAALVELARKEKKESELFSFFPWEWLSSFLKDPETWTAYTTLLLEMAAKSKVDLKSAVFCSSMLWVAPHLLASPNADLLTTFRSYLNRIPSKEFVAPGADARRALAGVASAVPVDTTTRHLLQTLVEISSGDEKQFFEKCRTLCSAREPSSLQKDLGTYHRTGSVPVVEAPVVPKSKENDTGAQIETLLGEASPTDATLHQVLTLLEKYPGSNFDLWEKLFKLLKPNSFELAPKAWKIWLAKHPVSRALPEQGKYWQLAIERTLESVDDSAIGIFETFFNDQLVNLLEKLEASECLSIAKLCSTVAIQSSWKQEPSQYAQKLKTIHALVYRKALKQKLATLLSTLDEETQIRFALLAVSSDNPDVRASGHGFCVCFISAGIVRNTTSLPNNLFFTHFCEKPYVPNSPQHQEIFYQWIEKCWAANKHLLSWSQVCKLLQTLCQFDAPEAFSADTFYEKWESAALETWGQRATYAATAKPVMILSAAAQVRTESVLTIESHFFFEASRLFMRRLMEGKESLDRKLVFLEGLNKNLKIFIQKHNPQSLDRLYCTPLILFHASCALADVDSSIPRMRETVRNALDDMMDYLPLFASIWNTDCMDVVQTFSISLPGILRCAADEPKLMEKTIEIIDYLMTLRHVRQDSFAAKYSWGHLLFCVCSGIQRTPPAQRRLVSQAVMPIFSRCTHPDLLRGQAKMPLNEQKELLALSSQVLARYFLPMVELECLEQKDWDALFNGLSEPNIRVMLMDLIKEAESEDLNVSLTRLISAIRILRYAPLFNVKFAIFLHTQALEISKYKIRPFNPHENHLFQLQVRMHIIQALNVLMHRLQAFPEIKEPNGLIQSLSQQQEWRALEFVQIFLKYTTEENLVQYSRVFVEIINLRDLRLLQNMDQNFIILPATPEALIPRLKLIKALIERNIKDLSHP